jgi:hypothetical protein
MGIDHFERVYYKVINYDTKEVVLEKAHVCEIHRRLGTNHHIHKTSKKGYYTHRKTKIKYQFIKLEDENKN